MSDSGDRNPAHVALLPSSGMGHLTPFLRLAVSLISHDVRVTLITTEPTVSLSESQTLSHFFSTYPQVTPKQLHLLPLESNSANSNSEDPFYVRYESIRNSSHLLSPLLSSFSPPLSALITDMSLASTVIPVTQALSLPNYVLFTSSAKMLTLFLSFHTMVGLGATTTTTTPSDSDEVKDTFAIPGFQPLPRSWIPPPLLSDTNSLLKTHIMENGKKMIEANGILINTSESFEHESLVALYDGKVVTGLPSVTPIGPLEPCGFERSQPLAWLEDQPVGSVVYVSFGSRTAMTREQITELGDGLLRSECKFVWVVKDKKVDREEDKELGELVGHEFVEKAKGKGLVVKHWVNQGDILGHPAVGGFVSHCGWNSVTEAMWYGVRMLAWPQHGDQKMNACVVDRIGLGIWMENWEWGGSEKVVKGEEITEKVREMMGNRSLILQAAQIREKARTAVGVGGSSKKRMIELVETWKKSRVN